MSTDTGRTIPAQRLLSKRKKALKLSPQQLEEIMIELRDGASHTVIAKQFKIAKSLVHQINEGERRCYRIDGMLYPIKNKKEERRLEDLEFRNREKPDERYLATVNNPKHLWRFLGR